MAAHPDLDLADIATILGETRSDLARSAVELADAHIEGESTGMAASKQLRPLREAAYRLGGVIKTLEALTRV